MDVRELCKYSESVNVLLARYGVKFGIYKNNEFYEQLFPFDMIPRVIGAEEFSYLERGLKQRVKALTVRVASTALVTMAPPAEFFPMQSVNTQFSTVTSSAHHLTAMLSSVCRRLNLTLKTILSKASRLSELSGRSRTTRNSSISSRIRR